MPYICRKVRYAIKPMMLIWAPFYKRYIYDLHDMSFSQDAIAANSVSITEEIFALIHERCFTFMLAKRPIRA